MSDDNDYVIGFLRDGTTVCGPAEPGELLPGTVYRFYGEWKENAKYGRQFHFVCAVKAQPHTREAVVQYLTRELRNQGTGIGEASAHKLFDKWDSDAVRMLREQPAAAAELLNIDVEKCRRAAMVLERDAAVEATKMDLIQLFAGKGFSKHTVKAVIKKWGAKAPALIRRDAFLLMTCGIPGAGFLRCDNLYLSLGGNPGRLKRQALAAWHGVWENSDHTWCTSTTPTNAVRAKISGTAVRPEKAVELAVRSVWLAQYKQRGVGSFYYADADRARHESEVATIAIRLSEDEACTFGDLPAANSAALSAHQKEQLSLSTARGRIGILAGTPGTGKTHTAAALIQAFTADRGQGSVAVCAPTGKAAARITESLQRYNLSIQGCTIHRLLKGERQAGVTMEWGFKYGPDEPLPFALVVVDEASMIDTDLMAALLSAIGPRTRLLLVGDPYQLPPVGHGCPLRDLIDAGMPYGELTEIHRNGGLIVQACKAIKAGQPFRTCERFDDEGNNLLLVNTGSPAAVFDKLTEMFAAVVQQGNRDPIDDIQIVIALNEKSELARQTLNPFLQKLLNPNGEQSTRNKFRVGDKVFCLKNGVYPRMNGGGAYEVFNGEMGRVTHVAKDAKDLGRQPLANGLLKLPAQFTCFKFDDVGDGNRWLKIPLTAEYADCFDLAYAATCHKLQGSEFPVVVVVGDEAADRVAGREWWYTAVSRARSRCVILGRRATVERQAKRVGLIRRKTFLVEKIRAIQGKLELGVRSPLRKPEPQAVGTGRHDD
jgi:exodeoxyribonuclease V alpha subunit